MGVGYAGADLMAEIEVDYEYLGHKNVKTTEDLNEVLSEVRDVFEMNLYLAKDISNYSTNVQHIGDQAVKYARSFLSQNGNVQTGRLRDSVEFIMVSGDHFQLRAPARDSYDGHPYAGHIEYGFTDRAGQPHGPWPFLRPAMRLAAADSRGELSEALASMTLYGSVRSHGNEMRSGNRLALGRSGNRYSGYKSRDAFRQMSNAYRSSSNGQTKEWGKAYNGFNQSSSRNSASIDSYMGEWDWGYI